MTDPARRSRGQRILVALSVVAALLATLATAGWLAWPSLLRSQVIQRARAQGVELEPGDLSWKPGELRIGTPSFRLAGIDGIQGRAEELVITLDRLRPTRVEARALRVEVTGDAPRLTLRVFDWARDHADAAKVPVVAHDVSSVVRPGVDQPVWLKIEGGELDRTEAAWRFQMKRALVLRTSFEPVVASWKKGDKEIAIAVRGSDPASSPIRLDVSREKPLSAKAQWKAMALKDVGDMIGVRVSARPITIGGKADLEWLVGGAVSVSAKLEMRGAVPPHPRELDGLLFGDKTSVSGRFLIEADRTKVTIGDLKVGAGSFLLTGGGHGQREGNTAIVELQLTGPVACSSLAQSAAKGRLGNLIGGVVADLVKRTLTGTLGVAVAIHADLANPEGAKVEPSLSGRCGVKLPP